MNLSKNEGNYLIDFYGKLLTDRQKEVLELYFSDDYSMSEIGLELNISKSAVSDMIHRSTNQLLELEEKLHLVANYQKRMKLYDDLKNINDKKVLEIVNELCEIEMKGD